jgi:hypothetical protein
MCNAHNHPSGCDCGWGGVWYGNHPYTGCGWLPPRVPRPRTMGVQKGTFSTHAAGFTTPNARCPVCGASVFFYQSPYGGRVYFDSLGPPWPKHPCTTHEYLASSGLPSRKSEYLGWYQEGWKPLTSVSIDLGTSGRIYKIEGKCDDRSNRQFFFAADELVMCEIVRFKPRSPGEFYISILDYDTLNNRWQTWGGIAYVLAKNAATKIGMLQKTIFPGEPNPPKPNEPTSHKAINKPNSSEPASLSTTAIDENGFQRCTVCAQKVLKKNLQRHIRRIHNGSLMPLNVPLEESKNMIGPLKGINWLPKPIDEYVDWKTLTGKEPWAILTQDQAKANLIWSVFPDAENGFKYIPDELVEGVSNNMDKETRAALLGMPQQFLNYWLDMNPPEYDMHYALPPGYLEVMKRQVMEAQARLMGRKDEGNVTYLKFRRAT